MTMAMYDRAKAKKSILRRSVVDHLDATIFRALGRAPNQVKCLCPVMTTFWNSNMDKYLSDQVLEYDRP